MRKQPRFTSSLRVPALSRRRERIRRAFYKELTTRWPEIDTVPEEEFDNMNYCPWSCALPHSGMAVVMACVWSMAEEVEAFVKDLAKKHGLVFFGPQADTVSLPGQLRA